jgi:hypothetical protein
MGINNPAGITGYRQEALEASNISRIMLTGCYRL